jgi:hypothetical protein
MSDAWHVAILVTCQLDHHQFNIYREGGGTRELTQKLFCLISTDCKEGKGTIKVGSLHGCTGVSSSSSIIYSRKNSPYNFTYKVTFILRFFRYSGLLVHQFFLPIYFALSRHCAHVLQDDIALFDFAHPPFFLRQTSAPHMKNKTRQ